MTDSNREQRRAMAKGRRRRAAGAALTASTAALGATAMLLAGGAAPAGANTFTVTTTNDAGAGSLRQAIIDANNNAGADIITFDPAVTGTITLASDLDVVDDDVDIQGPGASVLTVDADGFNAFGFDFAASSISGLTITGGNSAGSFGDNSGGGIALYGGSLSVTGVVLTGNYADNDGGGAWCNSGDSSADAVMTITDSVITGNGARGAGGGLYVSSCDLAVVSTTVSGNTSEGNGGGLYSRGDSTVAIHNSTISGNQAVSAGGGVFASGGTVGISNSTISGNTATSEGGGIYAVYTAVTLDQDTITNNSGATIGGVAIVEGRGKSVGSTQTDAERSEARSAAAAPGQVESSGTIIAGNTGTDVGTVGELIATSSIIGSIDPGTTFTDNGGNQLGVNPLLGPLANNGGPTQTHALLAGSPAIDKGPNPVASFPLNDNDQRGAGFPRVVAGTVDVGAFEVQAIVPSPAVVQPRFTG